MNGKDRKLLKHIYEGMAEVMVAAEAFANGGDDDEG